MSTSKKQVCVIFTKNNARIMINPETPPRGAIMNPDLSKVRGEPPHFWKLVDGEILPMSRPEKIYRLAHHETFGVDNRGYIPDYETKKVHLQRTLAVAFIIGFILGGWLL